MGNCFSDPSTPAQAHGKGQPLGSAPPQQQQSAQVKPHKTSPSSPPPQTLGKSSIAGDGGDPRERALRAAEERASASQRKGVHSSNPKAGQLSSKLAADRKQGNGQQPPNERMMDAGQWN